jgi:leucyl aminopeptidase
LAALDLLPEADRDEAAAFLDDVEHKGKAGKVHELPRPARRPERWLFVGIGDGGEAGWRSAGAALARKASKQPALTVLLPVTIQPDEVGALAEGLWLAAYRYRLGADAPDSAPKLRRVTLVLPADPGPGTSATPLAAAMPATATSLGGAIPGGPPASATSAGRATRAARASAPSNSIHAGPPAATTSDGGALPASTTSDGGALPASTTSDGGALPASTSASRGGATSATSEAGASRASTSKPAGAIASTTSAGGAAGGGMSAGGAARSGTQRITLAAAATSGKRAATITAAVRGAEDASAGVAGAGAGRREFEAALAKARVVAEATALARDLTNTPSARKTPAWMGRQIQKAASGITNLSVSVREPAALATEGFNGILAVGSGSANPPRLVELSWRPRGARRHVVLIGKGITFDTGGVCIKTRPGMKLMRKDMGGAAAVLAATLAAGTLRLPIRITALAPLAENSLGADSYRPGDVIRHYGGQTSEITNTDAEGRVVLADAIAYAVRRLRPDVIVDLATLTGAQGVALGKRTAAIFSDSDALAKGLEDAGEAAGESIWRLPLPDDYLDALSSDVADRVNSTDVGAGAVMAALYLREFAGSMRDNWAHIDMSSPAWSESNDGEMVKGATGWGVRTLLRWLESVAA